MSSKIKRHFLAASFLALSTTACASKFTLTSTDMSQGQPLSQAQEFAGFGCSGDNLSPQLSWSGAPEGTKAFAVFAYDPDAPTGSGWWHWQLVNLPSDVNELATGVGDPSGENLPKGSQQISNDYGFAGFGGACPPKGHGAHRYQFTVFALSQRLELPENPSSALVGYFVNQLAIDSATLEATYQRD